MNLLLSSDHDLDTTGSRLQWVEGSAEISQKLKCRYLFFQGEWFLDQRLGVPYFQKLFEKGVTQVVLRSTLQKVASTCPGVLRVDVFAVTLATATRLLSVSFQAILDDGTPIDFNEEFLI